MAVFLGVPLGHEYDSFLIKVGSSSTHRHSVLVNVTGIQREAGGYGWDMSEDSETPNTAQITVWRNLLDAFGQLSAAWAAARDAQRGADEGEGPASLGMPDDLVTSFTRAGQEAAESLSELAAVLARQQDNEAEAAQGATFDEVSEAARTAAQHWAAAHEHRSEH
jgi:hypothetical protein